MVRREAYPGLTWRQLVICLMRARKRAKMAYEHVRLVKRAFGPSLIQSLSEAARDPLLSLRSAVISAIRSSINLISIDNRVFDGFLENRSNNEWRLAFNRR
jgi:hypothetical protein